MSARQEEVIELLGQIMGQSSGEVLGLPAAGSEDRWIPIQGPAADIGLYLVLRSSGTPKRLYVALGWRWSIEVDALAVSLWAQLPLLSTDGTGAGTRVDIATPLAPLRLAVEVTLADGFDAPGLSFDGRARQPRHHRAGHTARCGAGVAGPAAAWRNHGTRPLAGRPDQPARLRVDPDGRGPVFGAAGGGRGRGRRDRAQGAGGGGPPAAAAGHHRGQRAGPLALGRPADPARSGVRRLVARAHHRARRHARLARPLGRPAAAAAGRSAARPPAAR